MISSILVNKAITPEGNVLRSRYRHDYVWSCDSEGTRYFLDGGLDYVRCGGEGLKVITLTTDSPIADIREHWDWGSYGKWGLKDFHYILLKDLSEEHINNILTLDYISDTIRGMLNREIEYRNLR